MTKGRSDSSLVALVKEYTAIWLVACLGVVLSGATLWIVEHILQANKSLEFEWVAHNRIGAFQQGIKNNLNAVKAIRDLFLSSEEVQEDDFKNYARSVMTRYRGIQALMWVRNVPHDQRLNYETKERAQQKTYKVLERLKDRRMVPAGYRNTYFPIHYLESREQNGYLGLDLASIEIHKDILERVRDSGQMAVSERVELLQKSGSQHGFFAYLPVYLKGKPIATQNQRRDALLGYAVGVFSLEDLAQASIALLEPRGVEFIIHDESASEGHRFLGFYVSRLSEKTTPLQQNFSQTTGPRYKEIFQVADQQWSITCTPTTQFRSIIAFPQSQWIVLGVGLLFTTLVTLYLIVNKQRLLEKIKMEQALREREELFWQMTETVDEVFWAYDPQQQRFLYVSPAYESLWGNSCEHLYDYPESFIAIIHEQDRKARDNALDKVRQGESNVEVIYRITQPNGALRWIRECVFPVRNELSDIYRIVGVSEDITERWLADQALQESEIKLRTLFNYSPDVIMTIDNKGRILMMNRSIPGLLAEKAIGRNSAILLPQDFRHLYQQNLKKVFRKGKVRHMRYSTAEGIWWEVRVVPLTVDDAVSAAMVVATDVTETTALHGQMMRTARLATIGVLAAGVAHEINNPNNAISFNASLFVRVWKDASSILENYFKEHGDFALGGLSYSEARETLPRPLIDINKNSKRIKRIVENLKHLSRQDADDLGSDVDVQAVLEEAAMILSNKIQKYTDAFQLQVTDELPTIKGNAQQLEQVFINIIMNALQSLQDRSAAVTVKAIHDIAKDGIVVKIKDEGTGMNEEQLQNLTKPFFTTKSLSGGMGLGLSISASIVERHKGSIKFKSEPDQGTTVTIKIPIGA